MGNENWKINFNESMYMYLLRLSYIYIILFVSYCQIIE